ncbi:V-type proton ATPase subunit H-like [Dendronephthya gigantea]|uniref:V-type proton ATPase subunit H-like n=1 Tax=Dendronephthya gigantea TaxID=151771 RepID=UPI00106A8899|nr:V-type proton ATPase subunit H-like [Dendronephthya gigantea]
MPHFTVFLGILTVNLGRKANYFVRFLERFKKIAYESILLRSLKIMETGSLDTGMQIATSPLNARANEVRAEKMQWTSYYRSQMISKKDFDVIAAFDTLAKEKDYERMKSNSEEILSTIFSLLGHLSKDLTVQYLLTLLDDMITNDKECFTLLQDYKKKSQASPWQQFFNLLHRQDEFIVYQSARIIAKLACWGKTRLTHAEVISYFDWLKARLSAAKNRFRESVVECFQIMLRIDEYRSTFVETDGVTSLVLFLLRDNIGFQLQYQIIFCLWLLSFNPAIARAINENNAVVPTLADILRDTGKEKVTRIILATLRNLLEKPEERTKEAAMAMIQCKLIPVLTVLVNKTWVDEDIQEDVEYVHEQLTDSVQDLSTFDEYAAEVRSGRLEWSPVHKSEKFWRENSQRLNEKNYELLKILKRLLDTSQDPLILSVSAHDIGEYVRHYPRGKSILETLGCKELVMRRMAHQDPNVRYEALLAVQKLMVHNWEYLGRQLNHSN